MCGIAGILNSVPSVPPDEGILLCMLGTIRHRGPDEFGLYLGDEVGLGSARLSIVDLAGGQQPIGNEDGTLWIVFNGEIFNHVELRAELEQRGHRFTTHADTEVIIHLFEDYGVEAFSRLNGQWALAIWDTRRRQLVLSRDRLGVRPLFYAQSPDQLVFGSEIKAVLAAPGVSTEIAADSLAEVFTYWSVMGERTFFLGVQQLKPGHYLIASTDGVESKPYWRLNFRSDVQSALDGDKKCLIFSYTK
jgi:asparagine synthase (glutamine-hydrolysing)